MAPTNKLIHFVALPWKSIAQHVAVGMGAASFWRGAWYILDDNLFPENAALSAASSWGLGVVGMAASQGLMAKVELLEKRNIMRQWPLKAAKFGALYTVAMSCVLVWRGTWVGWDVVYERTHPDQTPCLTHVKSTDPGHLTNSGVLSHFLAVSALCGTGLFASVLAPPAATSIVRDMTIRAGRQSSSSSYQGPATKLVQSLFGSSGSHAVAGPSPHTRVTHTGLARMMTTTSTSTTSTTTRARLSGMMSPQQQSTQSQRRVFTSRTPALWRMP